METTVKQNHSINVGVTYTKQFIKKGIATKYTNSENNEQLKKYECIGLLFRGIAENNFSVDALLFNNQNLKPFETIPVIKDTENPIYVDNEIESFQLTKSIANMKNLSVKKNVQFWDSIEKQRKQNDGPFVYFGKHTLELLTTGDVATVTFSGAKVNYGIGIRNYASVTNENSTTYPTLKAEVNLDSKNNNQYIPTVALGLPCPPQWSDGERSVNLKLTNDDIRFFEEVKSNFYAVKEKTRSMLIETEPNYEEMMKSWINLKIN